MAALADAAGAPLQVGPCAEADPAARRARWGVSQIKSAPDHLDFGQSAEVVGGGNPGFHRTGMTLREVVPVNA
jgi:hypothetical protein